MDRLNQALEVYYVNLPFQRDRVLFRDSMGLLVGVFLTEDCPCSWKEAQSAG